MDEEYYKSLYDRALEDVVNLSKENRELKNILKQTQEAWNKDMQYEDKLSKEYAELKNENAKLNLEIGKLQGTLEFKNEGEN